MYKRQEVHAKSTLHICWGAQAGLYYHYGVDKHLIDHKMFGVFEHKIDIPNSKIVTGFEKMCIRDRSYSEKNFVLGTGLAAKKNSFWGQVLQRKKFRFGDRSHGEKNFVLGTGLKLSLIHI